MEIEVKENGDMPEEWPRPASPIEVVQHLSEEAVRASSEALRNVSGSANLSTRPPLASGHRRARSEVVTSFHGRSASCSNFQKWKSQMQKALHWGDCSSREDSQYSSFDPEILANQKRQWYQLHSKTLDLEKYKEPTSLFEHFIIAGLQPDANLEIVEDAFVKKKKWEQEMARTEMFDFNMLQYRRPTLPTLEPQVLFKYPLGKKLALRPKDLAAFCFPGGVKARIPERTPSLSDLNELVYGQEHLSRDDLSFIFSLKVADNATLYGVCLHVQEFVQKPPAGSGVSSPLSQSLAGCSRFLVSAARCYCILTRVPLFDLHYEMLNSIIAQERLNRITQFVTEISLSDLVPSPSLSKNTDSPCGESDTDWMASAIPVDSAMALTAAAAGIIADDEVPSSRWEICSPGSGIASCSDHGEVRELDKDDRKIMHYFGDCTSESEIQSNVIEGIYDIDDNGHSPQAGPDVCPRNQTLERLGSFESLFSSARTIVSEDDDDEIFFNHDKDLRDEITMEWARENKNDLLQIVCGYHSMPLPPRGSEIIYQPLEHLQAIEYQRPPISALGVDEKYLDLKLEDSKEAAEVKLKLATAEEAVSLSIWTIATICRVLSLESVLALVTGVLLEKQVVVLCPNLGILSAVVLSLIPIIRPFEWQSLFLPILPGKMLDFLDAPVPFIVGIQHKLADPKMKTSNLVHVNVVKDQVKTCNLPQLPQRKELISELGPIHSTLSSEDSVPQRHPVYKCNEMQAEAAAKFLTVMRRYLESLCSDLRSHTITSVQSNSDRVSLLLKDSFIDSFPNKDRPFVKLFVDTQLFTVLSDSRLSSYENEYN
ncbi:DENN (AEX-3) domain-containing protein [Abeliophyllum distichum]|uniref:DENN (AEX-3) domain-containing protein n=1 Tax=Abeliophyllum distichum TaxID=126358 RepID=A0ABD1Q770_9LAMI